MAQRSFLFVHDDDHHPVPVLEAAHVVPLLWLALLDSATLDSSPVAQGTSLRLTEGDVLGLALERAPALARLRTRRPAVVAWVGAEAGAVLDQFAEFLGESPGHGLSLDLSEWADLFESREQALQWLREKVALFDATPARRRPAAVKTWLDELGLAGRDPDDPAFGTLLGGMACREREPWRRDPPRERRLPGDRVDWAMQPDRHFVADDGSMVATTVVSFSHVETPVWWSPRGDARPRALALTDDIGFVVLEALSGDGRSLFCSVTRHPGARQQAVRFGADGEHVLHDGLPAFSVSACTPCGQAAGGALYPPDPQPRRAAVWRAGQGVRELAGVAADSVVSRVSRDGRILAGEVTLPSEDGRWQGRQAWLWQDDGARAECVAQGWSVSWVALSPDGQRGVLAVQPGQHDITRLHYWRAGAAAVPVDCGRARVDDLVFSRDLGCALARVDGAFVLWRPDSGWRETVLSAIGEGVQPRHVASSGNWWAATVPQPGSWGVSAVLLWQRDVGLQRFDLGAAEAPLELWCHNACDSVDDFVLFGQWTDTGEPVTWTSHRGFHGWGAAPHPVTP